MATKSKSKAVAPKKTAVKSNSLKAKKILRDEIRSSSLTKKDVIDTVNHLVKYDRTVNNTFQAGKRMAQDGVFACYTSDMKNTLSKIYGKEKVKSWGQDKVEETYKNLMAREIAEIHRSNRMSVENKAKSKKKK